MLAALKTSVAAMPKSDEKRPHVVRKPPISVGE
jgi:hypothetical protein